MEIWLVIPATVWQLIIVAIKQKKGKKKLLPVSSSQMKWKTFVFKRKQFFLKKEKKKLNWAKAN